MGFRRGPGLLRTVARTAVIAGTAQAVSGNVARRQQQRWAEQEAEQQPEAAGGYGQPDVQQMQEQLAAMQSQQAQQAVGPGAQTDLVAELQKLGELKQAGILSDEEFAAAKAKLLA